jgi:hypothetical protein
MAVTLCAVSANDGGPFSEQFGPDEKSGPIFSVSTNAGEQPMVATTNPPRGFAEELLSRQQTRREGER